MQLIRMTYASVAKTGLGYDALTSILRTAATRNEEHGITGILCYSGTAFLQALEGPRCSVNRLYNRIVLDARHADCQVLSLHEIDERDFADWSMKLIRWEGAQTAQRRALLLRHARSASLEPWTMSAKQVEGFLRELADMERKEQAA